ncbi:MAG: diaminopimelate epimerase [Phycisphaerales bacterium]|nr:diaminopimelate epimerase [Phycisphaerales bacterium]
MSGADIAFVKMHGCGNDYIVLDGVARPELANAEAPWRARAREMCDRRTGIGADGVIVVSRGEGADDVRAEVVNSDGSPGGMCGNGIRMVAKLAIERGYVRTDRMTVEMGGRRVEVEGLRNGDGVVRRARADMGRPVLEAARVPVDTASLERAGEHCWTVRSGGVGHAMTFVSMGNPHAVMFVDASPGAAEVTRLGAMLERHDAFPERMNVHWARVVEPRIVEVATWERGAGMTMACGTGACAVCVAGAVRGLAERHVAVHMAGGVLNVRWDESSGCVWLGGPVAECFSGKWCAT